MQKKFLLIPAIAVALLAGAGAASAHGGMGGGMRGGFGGFEKDPDQWLARMTTEAAIIGVSVDEMKAAWAEGKTIQELALSKGLTQAQLAEKMKAAHESKQKEALQALVTKGYITQAQADARLAAMKTRQADMATKHGQMKKGLKTRLEVQK